MFVTKGRAMAVIGRLFQDGQRYYPVGSAPRPLPTTDTKIRELMSTGILDCCQTYRSVVFLVCAKP